MIYVRLTGSQLHFKQTHKLTLTLTHTHIDTHTKKKMLLLDIFSPSHSSLSDTHISLCVGKRFIDVRQIYMKLAPFHTNTHSHTHTHTHTLSHTL